MNACEGSGYTLELQRGAHQVAPLDTLATAGREGIAVMLACYRHILAQHAPLRPQVSTATQQSTPWDAAPGPRCISDSVLGMGGDGGGRGPSCKRIHMWTASPSCLPGLALHEPKAEREILV